MLVIKGKSVLAVGVPTEKIYTAENNQNKNHIAEAKVEANGKMNISIFDWMYKAVVLKTSMPSLIALQKNNNANTKMPLKAHST